MFDEIHHFFSVYKDLEGKKISVDGFENATSAIAVIEECIARYHTTFCDNTEGEKNEK